MSSRLVLGIAAAGVCALLVALWFLIDLDPSAADAPAARRDEPAPAPVAKAPSDDPWTTPRARVPLPVPATPGSPAPSVPEGPAVEAQTPEQALHLRQEDMRRAIRKQLIATEQLVIDCLDKAGTTTTKLGGWATFPFTIARKAGKVVVETSTVDESDIADPALVECIRSAAFAMKFDELPPGVDRVTSYRKVVLKDGALHENWLGPHETMPPGH